MFYLWIGDMISCKCSVLTKFDSTRWCTSITHWIVSRHCSVKWSLMLQQAPNKSTNSISIPIIAIPRIVHVGPTLYSVLPRYWLIWPFFPRNPTSIGTNNYAIAPMPCPWNVIKYAHIFVSFYFVVISRSVWYQHSLFHWHYVILNDMSNIDVYETAKKHSKFPRLILNFWYTRTNAIVHTVKPLM